MPRGEYCPGCDQPFDGVHLNRALRPVLEPPPTIDDGSSVENSGYDGETRTTLHKQGSG